MRLKKITNPPSSKFSRVILKQQGVYPLDSLWKLFPHVICKAAANYLRKFNVTKPGLIIRTISFPYFMPFQEP